MGVHLLPGAYAMHNMVLQRFFWCFSTMVMLVLASACGNDNNVRIACTPGPCQLAGTLENGVCVNPNKPDGTVCVDENTCAINKTCLAGACVGTALPDGTQCDDHNACTQKSSCVGGTCIGSDPVTCAPEDSCHYAGVCDPNIGCQSLSKGPCTENLGSMYLTGCPSADYWAKMTLGGSQTFDLIVDSGSSTLALAGSTCSNCDYESCGSSETSQAVSPEYTPGSTSTSTNTTASGKYGDNSGWNADVYSDIIHGGTSSDPTSVEVTMKIASMTSNSDFFGSTNCLLGSNSCSGIYQGILGLGQDGLAAKNTNAFIPRLGENPNSANAFATQLCNNGGRIWFGGYDPNYISSNPNFIPLQASYYYAVTVQDLKVSGNSLNLDMSKLNPLIVDTGTSDFLLVQSLFNTIVNKINSDPNYAKYFDPNLLKNAGYCYQPAIAATSAQLDAVLPTFSLSFTTTTGSTYELHKPATQSYLVPIVADDGDIYYCPGIASIGSSSNLSILGGAFMRGEVVIFDPGNDQVGFAPGVDCVSPAASYAKSIAGP